MNACRFLFLSLLFCLLTLPGCGPNERREERGGEISSSPPFHGPLKAKVGLIKSPTAEEFDALLSECTLVLVDFKADWCGPCRLMTPIIKDLEKDYEGRVTFIEVDVDQRSELAARYNITSIPRLLVFHNGKEAQSFEGVTPRIKLARVFDRELGKRGE